MGCGAGEYQQRGFDRKSRASMAAMRAMAIHAADA